MYSLVSSRLCLHASTGPQLRSLCAGQQRAGCKPAQCGTPQRSRSRGPNSLHPGLAGGGVDTGAQCLGPGVYKPGRGGCGSLVRVQFVLGCSCVPAQGPAERVGRPLVAAALGQRSRVRLLSELSMRSQQPNSSTLVDWLLSLPPRCLQVVAVCAAAFPIMSACMVSAATGCTGC